MYHTTLVAGRNSSSSTDSAQLRDLRSLSSAIMSAVDKAELVAHETDLWLNGNQRFDNLDKVTDLISEAEVIIPLKNQLHSCEKNKVFKICLRYLRD